MSNSPCTRGVAQAQQDALRFQIEIAILKKQQAATKAQAAAAVQLLEAVTALAKSEGKGAALDTVA
jgi:hypothetical protein